MSGSNGKRKKVRCAIYTRKSTEEGLDQEFNSLDAQREAGEAFVASQKHEGWLTLSARYDDGGFTGGNAERPALQRMLHDIESGEIDCVVVYKVDRLSRSLLDFAKLMETFDKHGVAFVSVTQQFNTNHSMGRLTLNILLSFAQFERDIIGERIRDKLAAQSRKGKWTGGHPILGYDVDRSGPSPKLVVNKLEAVQVRQIFDLYLSLGSLQLVVIELNDRGWVTKRWTTKAGRARGGASYDKMNVHTLLTNPLYIGKIRHKGDLYEGEHEAIIERPLFRTVSERLKRNGLRRSHPPRSKHGSLLRGLLFCKGCGKAMTHTYASTAKRRYRYYTCTQAIKVGRHACPSRSLPALEMERAVVEEVRGIVKDHELRAAVFDEAEIHFRDELKECELDRDVIERELRWLERELRQITVRGQTDPDTTALVADLQTRIFNEQQRYADTKQRLADLESVRIEPEDVTRALRRFDEVWDTLKPREQWSLLNALIERVEFDARDSSFEIEFADSCIKMLSNDNAERVS